MEDLLQWAGFALTPLTGVVTWFVGRHTQRLEFAEKQSDTIAKLQAQNSELLNEIERLQDKVVSLYNEVSELKVSNKELNHKLEEYLNERQG